MAYLIWLKLALAFLGNDKRLDSNKALQKLSYSQEETLLGKMLLESGI